MKLLEQTLPIDESISQISEFVSSGEEVERVLLCFGSESRVEGG